MEQYVKYLRKSRFDRDYAELSIEETLKRHESILDRLAKKDNGTLDYAFHDGQFDTTLIFHFEAQPEKSPELQPLTGNTL